MSPIPEEEEDTPEERLPEPDVSGGVILISPEAAALIDVDLD